jgi:hypothetical protein
MSKHFRVPGRLATRLQESGIRVSTLLQNAGLLPGLLDQPRILVTTEELFALWRGIGQASTNPAIGLELGTETKPEHFDPIALVALSTDSFGEAMRQMARYKQLSCPEEIIHETDDTEWSIQFRWLLANDTEPEVLTDLCFAWVLVSHVTEPGPAYLRFGSNSYSHACMANLSSATLVVPLSLEAHGTPLFSAHPMRTYPS